MVDGCNREATIGVVTLMWRDLTLILIMILMLGACGGGGGGGGEDDPAPRLEVGWSLTRIAASPLDRVRVSAAVTLDGAPANDAPVFATDRGTLSAATATGSGRWSFELTPDGTGVHRVTLSTPQGSASVRPLVCAGVADGWGQPRLVEGMVNTAGYEDGAHVSADGEWLMVQYGPVYMMGLLAHGDDPGHPLNTATIGPYSAPLRPDFFTRRIVDGEIEHHLVLLPEAGEVFSPPTLFYGFRRQADGSFAQPFLIALDDARGANLNPFGLQMIPDGAGGTDVVFALLHPFDRDSEGADLDTGHDIFRAPLIPGERNILARWSREGLGPVVEELSTIEPLDLPDRALSQGNPFVYLEDGVVRSLWTDAEHLNPAGGSTWNGDPYLENITVHELTGGWPDGTWTATVLPSPVNTVDGHERQPCFDGGTLYFAHDTGGEVAIRASTYHGGAFDQSASWGEPTMVIDPGDGSITAGSLLGAGEPSIARRPEGEELYFVVLSSRGLIGPDDDVDIDAQVAMVPRDPSAPLVPLDN